MKVYLRIYRWAMQMKMHMALYTFTAVFLKVVCELLQGKDAVLAADLITMWVVSLVFAMLESAIFTEKQACTRTRSLIWLAAGNLCFIGGAWWFGWFTGLPLWADVLLAAFLELGLGLMWFGDRIVLKLDSAQLTKELKQYQKNTQQ